MNQRFVRFGGLMAVLILMTALVRAPQPQAAASQMHYDFDVRDDASVFARINSGGYEGQHLKYGYFWNADQAFSGGKVTSNPSASIAGTDDDDLYRRARVAAADLGGFGYAIPLPLNTSYTVRLHFAETYWGATNGGPGGAGRRIFSANFEGGAAELTNFDINAEVGPQTAVVKEFSVPVSDGVLNIDFSASVNRPIVSAIEVLLYDAPQPYQPAAINTFWIDADTDQLLDVPEYGDETDGMRPINLATLPTLNLNIMAEPTPGVGSIKFIYKGQVRIENTAPYAAFGNQGADYLPWTPTVGEHELTVIAYTQPNAQGVAGPTRRFFFQVSDQSATATPHPATATPHPATATPTSVPGTPTFVPATGTPIPSPAATGTPTFVPATATPSVGPPPGHGQFKINVVEQLRWYEPGTPDQGDFDIVIVQDTSQSMGYCWDRNQNCQFGSRRIDYASTFVRGFVHEMLVYRAAQGLTNRVAYITYGPQENGISARLRVPLSGSSLSAYEPLVGSINNPRIIPAAEVSGSTNTAAALRIAQQELGNARTVDQNGNPVRQIVILVSDGTADVLFDAPYAGLTNRFDAAPFYCGDDTDDINDPIVQSSCPRGPAYGEPRSPIGAAVGVANDIRTTTNATIYSVVTGESFYSLDDYKFDEISPGHSYLANRPQALEELVNNLVIFLGAPCTERIEPFRLAAGAQVIIRNYSGQIIHQGVLGADGSHTTNLWQDFYTVSVVHNGVIAPPDPLQIARNYTRLTAQGYAVPTSAIGFTINNYSTMQLNAQLVIDNEANAGCPLAK